MYLGNDSCVGSKCKKLSHEHKWLQLVFSQNVKLPNLFHDQISAGTPETKTVREHISALHAARKAFINAETSDKLHLALHKQLRKTRQYYEMNDIVYYKCNIDDKWKIVKIDAKLSSLKSFFLTSSLLLASFSFQKIKNPSSQVFHT